MAKANYQCPACDATVTVSGRNRSEADRFAAYKEKRGDVCRDCERKAFQATHDAAVAAAAVDPLNAVLPTLSGTEKQVAWAQALRLEALPMIEQATTEAIEAIASSNLSQAAVAEMVDAMHLLSQEVRGRVEASYWIDSRHLSMTNHRDGLFTELRKRVHLLCPTAHAESLAAAQAKTGI